MVEARIQVPLWLTMFLLAVVALVLGETLLASRRERDVIRVPAASARERQALRLRMVAGVAVMAAVLQRVIYRAVRADREIDRLTGLCLAVALGTVAWSRWLTKVRRP